MARRLVVVMPKLKEELNGRILESAGKYGFEVEFYENEAEAFAHLEEAEVILGQSASLAEQAPELRWICTPSAGVNQFQGTDLSEGRGVLISNSSGAYGVTISEHIIMVTLEMLRRQQEYTEIIGRRVWTRALPVRSIKGSRIVLMGTGDLGREAAVRLRAFGPASLTGVNRSGRNPDNLFDGVVVQDQLETVLPQADLLILTLPGTAETYHILSADRLAMLPDHALVVNVGRGSLIDQKALEKELRTGRLSAALDVFEQEPVPQEDTIWDCPNLLITPHIAGNMTLPYTVERIVAMFLEDFENYCEGRPLKRKIDLARGY